MVWARKLVLGRRTRRALVLCLATAYGAYVLAGYSWDQVVSYESPYRRARLAHGRIRSPRACSPPRRQAARLGSY